MNFLGNIADIIPNMTKISDFDYELPDELIAQEPASPRDHSKLMLLDKTTGGIEHRRFFEIVDELGEGDVLVMNNSKVFKARLRATLGKKEIEVFLLRFEGDRWQALLRPGRKVKIGDALDFNGMTGVVEQKREDGTVLIAFDRSSDAVLAFTDDHGEVPLPPYITKKLDEEEKYQTVYAKDVGSVAAPTAGFHFTPEIIKTLKAKGVQVAFVTLHVGLGTFRPVKTQTLEEHDMHSELVQIDPETARTINEAKASGKRIIAVGTTTTRALEGVAALHHPERAQRVEESSLPPDGFVGDVNLFIKPGFDFKIIDALITNFHLPKSTLLVLVSALAGRENIIHAYQTAVESEYRFFSFGDAMFIR